MSTRSAPRSMKERAAVGSVWRRRRDKTLWVIHQSHRCDRLAELVPADGSNVQAGASKVFVSFALLRTRFEEVES